MLIHSSTKLSMISVWQVKLEDFLYYSKSQKSKQTIFLMTDLLRKVTHLLWFVADKGKRCSKNAKIMFKDTCIFKKCRPNHV